jgi:hypothetical protein
VRRFSFLLLSFGVLSACSDPSTRPNCPPPVPAFRLELTAEDGPLPPDTSLSVTYQGSQKESYRLSGPASGNEDVCCRPGARLPDGVALPHVACGTTAPDVGVPEAIFCELWTNGLAEVGVTGHGYPSIDRVLETRKRDRDCGVDTVDVHLALSHPDGGS